LAVIARTTKILRIATDSLATGFPAAQFSVAFLPQYNI